MVVSINQSYHRKRNIAASFVCWKIEEKTVNELLNENTSQQFNLTNQLIRIVILKKHVEKFHIKFQFQVLFENV